MLLILDAKLEYLHENATHDKDDEWKTNKMQVPSGETDDQLESSRAGISFQNYFGINFLLMTSNSK